MMKLKMLTELRQKRKFYNIWYNSTGINELSQLINITVTEKCAQFNHILKVNENVLIMNLNLKMSGDKKFVYFTKDKKVFMTSPFEVKESVIQDFLHAPKVTIAGALGSPHNRRLSIKGTVINVSEIEARDSWRKSKSSYLMSCKLWNDYADESTCKGSVMMVSNVAVNIFNSNVEVNTTDNSQIVQQAVPEHQQKQLKIEG